MTEMHSPERLRATAHAAGVAAVLEGLASRREGLSGKEARQRLARFGPNRLPEAAKEGLLRRFFKHFHDLLIYILLAAAAVTALLDHWIDTGVILGVVLINAVIGFLQEGKAEQALAGLRKMLSHHAQVRRDGAWHSVDAETLVPGDVVRLRSGDRIPADLRLLEVTRLRIEESPLTGESQTVEKGTAAVAAAAPLGDRLGMAYAGTMVAAGRGLGVVVATGAATELGRINRLLTEVEKLATPLTRRMASFSKGLAGVILLGAAVLFAAGWFFHDYSLGELFLAAIGFAVAAIPEGLPAQMTITLAIGVQRMARRNAIIRRLPAVETLGSVTVICSDKTGTLTRNEMVARTVRTAAAAYEVSGEGYSPEGRIEGRDNASAPDADGDLTALLEAMAVCNDADLYQDEQGAWRIAGEPTEGALQALGRKGKLDPSAYERLAVLPFESENKLMATLNRRPGGALALFVKGAPDRLLERCGWQRAADGSAEALDRDFWFREIDALAETGQRVLAAAAKPAAAGRDAIGLEDLDSDLVFLGVVGILDPPRPEAIASIRNCQEAGIRVKMITGDHAGTAQAIGREMGIGDGRPAVTGATLEEADDAELRRLVRENDIFARTSPEHKLRLVQALQAEGEVVAMTGDGVNDAPALKRADVGVAMGIKGTEVTKEAADIVLADDNFTSIENAVEEGRTIYDNLRKAILFILPTNGAEALVILAAIAAGRTLPITPVQILWVNMVTAVTLALALAFEPTEPGIMQRPPRRPGSPLLGGYFLWRIAFISLLVGGATLAVYVWARGLGLSLEQARTMAVNTLVAGELFYLFNSRFLEASSLHWRRLLNNRVALLAAGVLLLLQALFVYLPAMNLWFGTSPLAAHHWLVSLAVGIAVFLLAEAEKALYRRRPLAGR